MTEYIVADSDEIDDGDRIVVELEGREIGVFKLNGEYYAYLNWCVHQSGPVCEGIVTGTIDATYDRETGEVDLEWSEERKVLNCPWHGWEYELATGDCLSKEGVSLPSFPVREEDGNIVISL